MCLQHEKALLAASHLDSPSDLIYAHFNNTILDSTKDTLVITAVGGAQQVPFLTLYVVLPISVFVVATGALAQREPLGCSAKLEPPQPWGIAMDAKQKRMCVVDHRHHMLHAFSVGANGTYERREVERRAVELIVNAEHSLDVAFEYFDSNEIVTFASCKHNSLVIVKIF